MTRAAQEHARTGIRVITATGTLTRIEISQKSRPLCKAQRPVVRLSIGSGLHDPCVAGVARYLLLGFLVDGPPRAPSTGSAESISANRSTCTIDAVFAGRALLRRAMDRGGATNEFEGLCLWSAEGLLFQYALAAELACSTSDGKNCVPSFEPGSHSKNHNFQRIEIMLVLMRNVRKAVMIGDEVTITILRVRGNQVRLGITAPKHVAVHRQEVYARVKREQQGGQGRVGDKPTRPVLYVSA